MKKGIWNIWLAVVVGLVIVAPALARVVTVKVEGIVNSIGTDGGFALDGSVSVGSTMSGYCTYETDAPDENPSEGNGDYLLISISMNIGNYTFTHNPTSPNPALFKVYTANPCYKVNSVSPRFDGTVIVDGLPLTYDDIIWGDWAFLELMDLGNSSHEYIPNDALPDLDSFPDLSVFDRWRAFETRFYEPYAVDRGYFGIYGEVTSLTVTPEPATTYYVDALNGNDDNGGLSPETAFATIQKGIDSADDGDTVIAAPGTYTGDGNRDIDFKGKAITVRSTDPNDPAVVAATIINCNGTETEPHRGFYFYSGEDANSVLAGFTITDGYISVVTSWPCNGGGAIRFENSSPTIINCTITSNKAVATPAPGWCGIGGGLSCFFSDPTIANCTIRYNSAEHGGGGGISCLDSNPKITNCIITGNTSQFGGGAIYCNNSSPILSNSTIAGNSARTIGGIDCANHSNPVITNCLISGNSAEIYGGGVGSWHQSRPTLTNCIISGNIAGYGSGIFCHESSPIINNCTISDNTANVRGGGLYCADTDPIITNCIFWGNSPDEIDGTPEVSYTDVQGGWDGEGNIDVDPCFVEPGYWADWVWVDGDYHLLPDSPCINTGNPNGDYTGQTDIDGDQRVINGRVDMGADEFRGPIYVDNDAPEDPGPNNPDISDSNENGSFAHPFDAIQEAIDIASNGETVVVLDGTYTGSGNRDIDFLGKAITVRSIDPNDLEIVEATIIDCNATETNRHRGFYFYNNEDSNSVLAGFTIINGYAWGGGILCDDGSSPTITNCKIIGNTGDGGGGGIFCHRNSSPTITNCTITGNSANFHPGGGISCWRDSNPVISNCIISGNTAGYGGGGMCNRRSTPKVTNCTFSGNSVVFDGGGMYNEDSSPTVTNCTFSRNSTLSGMGCGGGMYNSYSSPTVSNCTFSGSTTLGAGGGIYNSDNSNPTVSNCTFSWNSANSGGGMGNVKSSPILTNCTFSGNSAEWHGGGMWNIIDSSPTVTNCILWGNTAQSGPQIYNYGTSSATVTYSDVQGGWPGEGNINADPRFAFPNDYHLMPDSPCIDAGDNTAVPADTTDLDGDGNTAEPIPFDLDGNPRIVDGNNDGNPVVDMGAYEAMVSCFGVNHVKLETKAGKKGNKVELKGTFSPALPIDFAVDDVAYIIDDGQGNTMAFLILAGSFEVEGKPGKQKFKFDSPKGSQPDIKAKFDFDKCKFELKAKKVPNTDEITGTTLTIELWAGANVAQEVVEVKIKPRHLEYKREPKLDCCPKCKGIALLEVTSTGPFTGDEYVLLFEPDPGKEKLKRKTVVDDGVNGRVKIDTSCSKPLEVGDVFGVYTVTDLIKIFDDWPDDD